MTTKNELAELENAIAQHTEDADQLMATTIDAALKSAVRAVLPGRQQKGNLAEPLAIARKAFIRTLRRRTR